MDRKATTVTCERLSTELELTACIARHERGRKHPLQPRFAMCRTCPVGRERAAQLQAEVDVARERLKR